MKPKSFFDLPSRLQESLLWEMELNYDPYESSKAETIHYLNNADCDSTNRAIIENAYKYLTEDSLKALAKGVLEQVNREKEDLESFLTF